MRRFLARLFILAVVLAIAAAGALFWWLHQPLALPSPAVDLSIEPGTTPRGVARAVAAAGVRVDPRLLYAWFRFSGQDRLIKAGSYELETGITPHRLLAKLVRGDEAQRAVTLVEGWNWRQVREALAKAEQLRADTQGLDDAQLMERLGRPGVAPEGRFFPDTYTYSKGSTDVALLQRALRAMDRHLDAAWALRAADTPLKSPEQLLTLASIVEKETGRAADRAKVAAVFINRLRINMPLQTDPTVIYGMGAAFDGNLRKKDLLADTPWNTYTRAGLPPTPIAMPGKAALLAAAQPDRTDALYFVSRGDGSSHFSPTLDDHNRAVNQYQRGVAPPAAAVAR
ncbi:endolytic transglycosylase MltG [Xylophilus sp.]|uniref:endolytic transglycosylase MltG n=1 Tax=Xylophilus sp. TaxID=2653893 RepID=UPI0013B5D597|nr:endolytic transglycosylase MltG [Xylophilus sp.]KAF1048704.1 MAG: Endolytic murein transglycosylase [Xylophilus sp.]